MHGRARIPSCGMIASPPKLPPLRYRETDLACSRFWNVPAQRSSRFRDRSAVEIFRGSKLAHEVGRRDRATTATG